MIDKYAPIVPFCGIGGIRLGSTKDEVEAICERELGTPTMLNDGKWSRYRIDDLLILLFEEQNGTLIKITALPEYRGKLFDTVGTDFLLRRLMEMEPSFIFDEFDEICYSEEKGVVIDAATLDGPAEWISVYAKEMETDDAD